MGRVDLYNKKNAYSVEDNKNVYRIYKNHPLFSDVESYHDIEFISPPKELYVGEPTTLWACGIYDDITMSYYDMSTFNIVSDDKEIATIEWGCINPLKTGMASFTVSDYKNTISETLKIPVITRPQIEVLKTLKVNNGQFGIHNDGTSAEDTTIGLKDVLEYASKNGYQEIVFEKGNYLLMPSEEAILLPSNMIVDFNGSTVQVVKDNDMVVNKKSYAMFSYENAENCVLRNGTFYGDNYYGGDYHVEKTMMLTIADIGTAKNIVIENCEFSYSCGFNVTLGMSYVTQSRIPICLKGYGLWAGYSIETGGLDNSGNIDDEKTGYYRTNRYIKADSLNTKLFSVTNVVGSGNPSWIPISYNICFYDEDYKMVSKLKACYRFSVYTLPENVAYFKIEFPKIDLPSSASSFYDSLFQVLSIKDDYEWIKFDKCTFKKNKSLACFPGGGRYVRFTNCTFDDSGVIDPQSSLDWEDGGWNMDSHIVDHCTFINSGSNRSDCRLTSVWSRNLAVFDNVFKRCQIFLKSGTHMARIFRNTMIDSPSQNFAVSEANVIAENILLPGSAFPAAGGTQYKNKVKY